MAFKGVKFNSGFNVNRVVKRLVRTVLALYVGGTIMTVFGTVMNGTASPFYTGLSLIGWSVGTQAGVASSTQNYIYNTTGSGVLAVVGIIAVAQIVTEFITW